jgi:hypothetical protein
MINEQRELLNVRNEVALNQVVDFGPLQRVVKDLSWGNNAPAQQRAEPRSVIYYFFAAISLMASSVGEKS